jgi:hypothetical protein
MTGVQLVVTAWSYFVRAAQHLDARTTRRVVPRLVDPGVWAVLMNTRQAGDARLGGPLIELMTACEESLRARGGFMTHEHRMSQLRRARLAFVAMQL